MFAASEATEVVSALSSGWFLEHAWLIPRHSGDRFRIDHFVWQALTYEGQRNWRAIYARQFGAERRRGITMDCQSQRRSRRAIHYPGSPGVELVADRWH